MKLVHYHVLANSNRFESDELKDLTYQLCNTDLLSIRNASLPAPIHYAHLLANRCRNYLDEFFVVLVLINERNIVSQ